MTIVYCQSKECKYLDGNVCICDSIFIDGVSGCVTEEIKVEDDEFKGEEQLNNINKVRPSARVTVDYGPDGRDMRYYIEYRCPVCNNWIMGYKQETSCDKCGAYFDWGNREPKIVVKRSVEWE